MNRLVSVICMLSGHNLWGTWWFYIVRLRYVYLYVCCTFVCVYEYMHIESSNNLKFHDKLSNIDAVPQQTDELVIYTLHLTLKK